ncbi:MAG: hypothetical protein ACE15C_07580 [Phycisphaerae bacterium]
MSANKTLVTLGAFIFSTMFSLPDRVAYSTAPLSVAGVTRTPIGRGQEIITARLSDSTGQVRVVLVGWGKFRSVTLSGRDRCVLVDGWKIALPAGRNIIAVYAGGQTVKAIGTPRDFRALLAAMDGNRLLESDVWRLLIVPALPPLADPDGPWPENA